MKDGQRLIVKVIHSESDLPKESGYYFVSWHDIISVINNQRAVWEFIQNKSADISIWIAKVDWYLIPEPEIETQSKNFVCCKCKKEFDTLDKLAWHKTIKGQCPQKSTIENPDFFEQKIEDEITDADIEAWAEKKVLTDLIEDIYETDVSFKECLIIGAKAMRDGEIKHIEK